MLRCIITATKFIYVDRFDKYEDAMKKVEEIRENTEIPDPWILDVANYE